MDWFWMMKGGVKMNSGWKKIRRNECVHDLGIAAQCKIYVTFWNSGYLDFEGASFVLA